MWHDPEGNPPPPELSIPQVDGAFSPAWTDWTWDSVLVEGANCREIIDNVVDMAHFFYIHFAFPTYFKNVLEGHVATQYLRTRSRPDIAGSGNYGTGDENTLRSEASYFGPSYMINYLWHDYRGTTMESVLINCHYPVTPTSFMLQWGVIVERPAGISDEHAAKVGGQVRQVHRPGLPAGRGDLAAQEPGSTTRCCAPRTGRSTSCGAGTSSSIPTWPTSRPDMVARYEFEVDTSRAVQGWEAEVAENLARRANA